MSQQATRSSPLEHSAIWGKINSIAKWSWNASRSVVGSWWNASLGKRGLRYMLAWFLGFGTGIWLLIALAWRQLNGGRFVWEKSGEWNWLSQALDRFAGGSSSTSYDLVDAVSSWLIVWSLILCTAWLYLRPANTTPSRRLRYLIVWVVGLVILIPGLNKLINTIVPLAAATLSQFTNSFPLLIIWSTFVFLLYLYLGDQSEEYQKYLVPYRTIWTVLSAVILVTVLTGYVAYQEVRARVEGDLSALALARSTTQQLQVSTDAIFSGASDFASRISAYEAAERETRKKAAPAEEPNAREALLDNLTEGLPQLEQHAIVAHTRAQATHDQIAITKQRGQQAASLTQIEAVLREEIRSTEVLAPAVARIAAEVQRLAQNDHAPLTDLRAMLGRELIGPAQDADTKARVLVQSMAGVNFTGLPIFLWVGVFYSVLVLFPWMLLLLFLYRKRAKRAAQILEDLTRLDPTHGLLKRALGGYRTGRSKKEEELHKILRALKPCQSIASDTVDDCIEALASQAFSNFEYMLSLLFLSVLNAVGWYYVFYPQTSLGLADLIENYAGVRELSGYMVANLTPITLGFAGAYFFLMQMLVRRYLADDLYPSAFLQATQRLLLVFILSLALSVFTVPPVVEVLANLEQGRSSATTATAIALMLAAFFTGIYPRSGMRLAATFVNKLLKTVFKIKPNIFPETLVPEPLTLLTGLTVWNEARLLEENVENIQSLATAPIEQIVLGTHFPTTQIVDWIDQAILYLHAGHDGEWFAPLRAVGIRSAYDILDATVPGLINTEMLCSDYKPNPKGLKRLVKAVNAASAKPAQDADRATAQKAEPSLARAAGQSLDGDGGSPLGAAASDQAAPQAAGSPARDGAREAGGCAPVLTEEILYEICDAIWPDPNVHYIVNFYQQLVKGLAIEDGAVHRVGS